MAGTRKPLAYRESTCTNLSVSCPYEITLYSGLEGLNTFQSSFTICMTFPFVFLKSYKYNMKSPRHAELMYGLGG